MIPVVAGLLLLAAAPAVAQPEGWEKVKRGERGPVPGTDASLRMLALEIGFPGVLATRAFFPVRSRQSVGGGPILLPGLTGLVGEYRFYPVLPRRGRLALHVGLGLTYYRIRSNHRSASAGGVFLALGTSYRTRSRFLLGGAVGTMSTTGSESDDPVESFGIRKGLSTTYVNVWVAYAL
jgi:hypothetical protein